MLEPNPRRPLLNTEIRRRGIYLLPNLFTTAALFAGFYAIVMAMNQRFDNAAVAIFVAMILDTLDGRVARLTHTQSAWGASAGLRRLSTAPERRSGLPASTPTSKWSISASSRDCRVQRQRRWWPG